MTANPDRPNTRAEGLRQAIARLQEHFLCEAHIVMKETDFTRVAGAQRTMRALDSVVRELEELVYEAQHHDTKA